MKHTKRNSIIILIITIVFLYFLLKDNYIKTFDSLKNANILWILIAIAIYVLYLICDNLVLHRVTKLYKKDISFKYTMALGIMTKFFNGITPLASGGQPLQVMELRKQKIKVEDATSIIAESYMLFQIVLVFFALGSILLNQVFHIFTKVKLLKDLTILGFIANLVLLLFLLYVSFNKNASTKIGKKIIDLLYKLKILKDKDSVKEKWTEKCTNYHNNAVDLLKNKIVILYGLFFYFVSLVFYHSIPFFIMKSLGISVNIVKVIIASCYAFIMSCYVPIPGATGGAELCFLGIMANFLNEPILSSTLIIWRFVTYYLPTIIGAIVFNVKKQLPKKVE